MEFLDSLHMISRTIFDLFHVEHQSLSLVYTLSLLMELFEQIVQYLLVILFHMGYHVGLLCVKLFHVELNFRYIHQNHYVLVVYVEPNSGLLHSIFVLFVEPSHVYALACFCHRFHHVFLVEVRMVCLLGKR